MNITIVDIFTLAISGFALYISLLTVSKQSKIELFDKRYDVYYQVQKIIKFKNDIKNMNVSNENSYNMAVQYFKAWCAQNIEFINMINSVNDDRLDELYVHFSLIESRKEEELKSLDKILLLYYLEKEEQQLVKNLYDNYKKMLDVMVNIAYKKDLRPDIISVKEDFIKTTENFDAGLTSKLRKVINVTEVI